MKATVFLHERSNMASYQRLIHGQSDFGSLDASISVPDHGTRRYMPVSSSGSGYAWNTNNARLKGVAYLSAMYMAVPIEEANVAITFEQSRFFKIYESKTSGHQAYSVSITFT